MTPPPVPTSEPAYLAYLAVFAAAAAGCLLGAWRAYRRSGPPGVRRGLVGLLGASGLWALSHVGVLLSPSLWLKSAFYEAGLIVGFGTVWTWVWFCSSYSGRSLHKKKAARWAAMAVFLVVALTKLTNPWHGLYFTAEWSAVPFRHLAVDHHVIYWITTSLSYALAAVGFFMLIEPLQRMQVGSGRLAGLFGLMALPIGANAVGYATPYLLGLSHEPIGVAAFALGVLFLYRGRFEETSQAGQAKKPALVLSGGNQIKNCRIKNYNEAAAELFPALRREGAAGTAAVGAALEDALPRLAEVLGGADEADRPKQTGRPEETGRPEGPGEISLQDETRQDDTRQDETQQDETRQGKVLELEGSDGETRYFQAVENGFRRGGGRTVILTDVTERELRRRTRESRLEVLFERSPDMIDVHDAEGNLLEANARFFEKTGYREPDLSGLNVWDLDRSIGQEEARELWAGMEVGDRRRLEGTYRRKDGSPFPVEVHIRRLQMEGEDRFAAIARDTTERKRAERQRQRERDRLETLFESLPTPVVRCRANGEETTITDANAAFEKTFGTGREEAEGKDLNALVVPEKRREGAVAIDWQALREGREEREVRRLGADGLRDFRVQVAGRRPEEGPPEIYAIYTDITDRKERERRLRQAETLFQNAQDALFLIDVEPGGAESEEGNQEFSIRRVNPAYEAATGFSGDDLYGRPLRDIFGEEGGRAVEERYRECARRREPIEYEEDLPVGGGVARWHTRIAPVMAEGEVEQIVGTTRDVTEERRRERELRRQRNLLEQTQRLAGAWEANLQAGEVSWSEKVYEIHEMDPSAEVSLEEGLRFYAPESRGRVEEATQALVEEGKPYDAELQIDTAEGNRRWVRTVGAPVETEGAETEGAETGGAGKEGTGKEGGEVTKIAGAFQDITERKEQERRRKQVIRRVTDGIVEVDSEWRFTLVNEQAEQIYGTGREEMLGESLWEVFPELDGTRFEEVYREAMEAREPTHVEEYFSGLGGWFDVQVYPGEDGGLAFYFEDVTERKERERGLREAKEEAERAKEEAKKSRREAEKAKEEAENASQMKSSLLANMSHEIRTPLTSIIGFAEALGAESADLELPEGSALPKYAELIEKGGKRLLQTLEGVLNLSKLEAGQMELSEEAVGLATEAERTAEELRPEAKEKGIDLQLETQEVSARADEGGVQIVLRNLLSNAIKYTGEGGRIWLRIYREEDAARSENAAQSENAAVLEVEDTGIGMEPSVADRLFEPFRQASEGFNREYEGTGVGLAVTREATEQMGGTIEVETEKGEGSRFTARFPQAGDAGGREED